jgi:predicted RNase H-like HicB family nuclease
MKSKYEIIIYWSSADNCFVAEVPELPGCMADGNDYNEVVENVLIVIDEWIETAKLSGKEIPMPKGRLMFA